MRNGMEAIFWVASTLLLYIYCGYGALLQVLPRRRELPGIVGNADITILIPAYNEEACLRKTLEHLFANVLVAGPKVQIIVASDGSSDRTVAIAREFEARGVTVLEFEERRGKSSVLNDAVAIATG